MDMPTADVLVHIYNVRLVAVPHFIHVLLCQIGKLRVRQLVFGRRVERDVQDGFLRVPVGEQVTLERPHRPLHQTLGTVRDVGNHPVAGNDAGMGIADLLLVVGYRPVERCAAVDFRYHNL